jgi:hypothetical protein
MQEMAENKINCGAATHLSFINFFLTIRPPPPILLGTGCDAEKREEGYRRADAVFLGLFEGFNPGEEMKTDFTDQNEYR